MIDDKFKNACSNGDIDFVMTFIEDVNSNDNYLLEACFEGHTDISEILIRKGKSIPYGDCLRISCHYNYTEIIHMITKWYIENNKTEELEKILGEFNIILDK